MRKHLLSLGMICLSVLLYSQSFEEVSNSQGINVQFTGDHYGTGASFHDVNDDGWDDITICQNEAPILLFINDQGNFLEPIPVAPNAGNAKSAVWVDYDNDGDADLFVTRYGSEWNLYRNDGAINDLQEVTTEAGLPSGTSYLTYGQAWGDVDRDGDLDLYVCNYDSDGTPNFFFLNNGDGTFTDISIESGTCEDQKYSFQASFIDYNHDFWPDLFIINDRLPESNALFKNEGGSFSDVTLESGLEEYFFAMNNSAADYDRDGDLDIYVSNNPEGNKLYRQEEDHSFTELATSAGVEVLDHSWSAQWIDYDNDGWEDLHVCTSPFWGQPGQNRFFINDHDGTFSLDTWSTGFSEDDGGSHCSIAGDFNNDGYFDLLVVNDAPDWTFLYEAIPGDNNFLKVGLEGTLSNRDGIGSWIEMWENGSKQVRYTICGEGYMTQNSSREIFGMGNSEMADSVIVRWPSGHVDTIKDVPANSTLEIIEGQSIFASTFAYGYSVCEGDSVLLLALTGFDHIWNTGVANDSLWVTSPGTYFYTATSELGVPFSSSELFIPQGEGPEIELDVFNPLCAGDATGNISVNGVDEGMQVYLDDLLVEDEIFGLSAGSYELLVIDDSNCQTLTTVLLNDPSSLEASAYVDDPLCAGESGSIVLDPSGGIEPYTIDWSGLNPDELVAGEYLVEYLDANGCMASISFTVTEPDQLNAEAEMQEADLGNNGAIVLSITGGVEPYSVAWSGPENYTGTGPVITNLTSGIYTATITDANGCITTQFVLLDGLPIEENEDARLLSVSPNPSKGYVSVSGKVDKLLHLEVFDISGKKVLSLSGQRIQNDRVIDLNRYLSKQLILIFTFEDHVQTLTILLET